MSHGSTAKIDQKEYLKKYLSGDKSKKKKKKKDKEKEKSKKVRIIDDDATAFQQNGNSDDEMFLYGEDAPQIVGEYVDMKPNGENEKKWRSIAAKDDEHVKQEVEDDRWGKKANVKIKDENAVRVKKEGTPDISPPRKRDRISIDRKRKGVVTDQSPPRQRRSKVEPNDLSPSRKRKNGISPRRRGNASDEHQLSGGSGDLSPYRRRTSIDQSPQRRSQRRLSTDLSPPRHRKGNLSPRRREHLRDQSPPSRRNGSPDQSPPRRRRNSIDQSPPRQQQRQQQRFSRDLSPPRKQKHSISPRRFEGSVDQTPPRRRRESLDQSPPRRRQFTPPRSRKGRYGSPDHSPSGRNNVQYRGQREIRRNSPRIERQSPARYRQRSRSMEQARNNNARNSTAPHQGSYTNPFAQKRVFPSNESNSPDRRQSHRRDDYSGKQSSSLERNRRNAGSNRRDNSPLRYDLSDQSPQRRGPRSPRHENRRTRSIDRSAIQPPKTTIHWETAAQVAQRKARRSPSGSPPPTHKPKATKTLDGKKAGLQDARALKEETTARRRDEDKMFAKMSTELSGRDAEVQVRSTGRRGRRARDAEEEDPEKRRHKEEREQKRKEQYDRWGKGLKQIEDHRARFAEQEYESSKPLARYADDEDLDRHLREQERAEDPMLNYIRRKKRDSDKKTNSKSKVPVYEGSYPENRFGIRPGHRWDGVDRSNGYEKKWFDVQNEKRAVQEDAYKYSVEDM